MLQAADCLRVRVQERDVLGGAEDRAGSGRQRLQDMEQRPEAAVLRLPIMQGRDACEHQNAVESAVYHQLLRLRGARLHILSGVLRFQEQQRRQIQIQTLSLKPPQPQLCLCCVVSGTGTCEVDLMQKPRFFFYCLHIPISVVNV